MKLILLGAPGAGKGTQAEKITERFNIPVISTGNIIRAAMKNGTEMGTLAKTYVEKGDLVPDEVVIGIIRERLSQEDCREGFILDGFPRTVVQAEAFDKMGIGVDLVIEIEVPDERIEARMSGRRVCPDCGATYHTVYNPPEEEGVCGKCGCALIRRKDDEPETVRERLKVYHQQTEPLKAYYSASGKLQVVKGQEELSDTTKLTLAVLENL